MQNLHVQVINLDRSKDRLNRITKDLSDQNIVFTRLVATDGRALTKSDLNYYASLRCLLFYGRHLSNGEIGCFRSHQRAAKLFLQSGQEMGLVLEDDAEIPADLWRTLGQLIGQIRKSADPRWELVNLGNAPKNAKHCVPLSEVTPGCALVRAKVFPKRTTSLLWSRRGARRFLEETRHICAPVDQHLHSVLSLRESGLATIPPLIPHASLPSEINNEPDAAIVRQVANPSAWYRFRRMMRKRAARRDRSPVGS
ncbi:glycosyltransferase family 25 protein [Salipiger sp. H15]|uniref:Glycosyltransferase family 25 protein n=1 Tax=Alloyangia sp. H15 TaxID=3029062 RepID=A0AAU8ANT1_9RHOB